MDRPEVVGVPRQPAALAARAERRQFASALHEGGERTGAVHTVTASEP